MFVLSPESYRAVAGRHDRGEIKPRTSESRRRELRSLVNALGCRSDGVAAPHDLPVELARLIDRALAMRQHP